LFVHPLAQRLDHYRPAHGGLRHSPRQGRHPQEGHDRHVCWRAAGRRRLRLPAGPVHVRIPAWLTALHKCTVPEAGEAAYMVSAMTSLLRNVAALIIAVTILQLASGLLGARIPLSFTEEGHSRTALGLIAAAYSAGF